MSTLTMPAMSTSPPIMMSDVMLDEGCAISETGTECIMPIDDNTTHDGIDNLVMAGGGDMKFGGSEI